VRARIGELGGVPAVVFEPTDGEGAR
jgi:hypothetical protein